MEGREDMVDLLGEKTALEHTRKIISGIESKGMPKPMYKKLVLKIYDNQLKKWTKLNRSERHQRLHNLTIKSNRGQTEVKEPPALLSERALAKVLNEKPGDSMNEQGTNQ